MSRRRKAQIRQVLPDPVYNSLVLSKFINAIMMVVKNQLLKKLLTKHSTLFKIKAQMPQ